MNKMLFSILIGALAACFSYLNSMDSPKKEWPPLYCSHVQIELLKSQETLEQLKIDCNTKLASCARLCDLQREMIRLTNAELIKQATLIANLECENKALKVRLESNK